MSESRLAFVPPVIAHRGACRQIPENTMAAFVAARETGARWIESDVKITADGVPVLLHDDELSRTTSGQGSIADTDWATLRQLEVGGREPGLPMGQRVATLTELLIFARETGMRLNLELKPSPGRAKATVMVAMIEAARLWSDDLPPPLLSSFDLDALEIAAQLHPDWPRGVLFDAWREDWREVAARVGASSLHFNAAALTPERLATLRDLRLPILAYTVNEAGQARDLLQNGVRAVFSDDPAALIPALMRG